MSGYCLPGADSCLIIVCRNCKKIELSYEGICSICSSYDTEILNYEKYKHRSNETITDAELLTILVQKSA